jgi:hypothetical protein
VQGSSFLLLALWRRRLFVVAIAADFSVRILVLVAVTAGALALATFPIRI